MKQILELIFLVLILFITDGCGYSDVLNYENYDVVVYQGEKYYKYETVYEYAFIGEREQVGYIHAGLNWQEDAYILKEDVEKNIIFVTDGSGDFWLKEGCEFVNESTEVKHLLITESPGQYDGDRQIMIFFEIKDFTFNKFIEFANEGLSSVESNKNYYLFLGYGNGIYQEIYLAKNIIDHEYYFLENVLHDGQYVCGWYKISDQYMEIIREKIIEFDEQYAKFKKEGKK